MKAVVAAFNQEKALVGAFSVITNLRICFGWNFLKHYCAAWARVSSSSWIFAYNASSDILASSRPGHLLSLDTGHEEAGVAQGENIQWCPGSSSEQVVKDYLF